MLRRGLAKVREIKESGRGGGGNYTLQFILKDGESAIIRIYGDFEGQKDPILCKRHYVHRLPRGQQYHNCVENLNDGHDHPGCVFCLVQQQDKGIKLQDRVYFWLQDLRKQHKLDQEVRVLKSGVPFIPGKVYKPEDYTPTKYPMCSAPKRPCQYCKAGNVANVAGYRYWELAAQYADQLTSQQSEIRDFCKCGGRSEDNQGTIQVVRYLCGNPECGEEVDFDPGRGFPVTQCRGCNQTLPPMEETACAVCNAPARCDIQDFLWKVTRSGAGTDTTYNFEHIKQSSPTDEELAEAEEKKPDFEKMLAPEAAELQASYLGVPSPFQTPGHGAQAYGEREVPQGWGNARSGRHSLQNRTANIARSAPLVPPRPTVGRFGSSQPSVQQLPRPASLPLVPRKTVNLADLFPQKDGNPNPDWVGNRQPAAVVPPVRTVGVKLLSSTNPAVKVLSASNNVAPMLRPPRLAVRIPAQQPDEEEISY